MWSTRPAGHIAGMTEPASLRALALICSLEPSPAPSSSEKLAGDILGELAGHGVTAETVRVVGHDVRPGVEVDMGEGDTEPAIREQLPPATSSSSPRPGSGT